MPFKTMYGGDLAQVSMFSCHYIRFLVAGFKKHVVIFSGVTNSFRHVILDFVDHYDNGREALCKK